MLRNKREEFSDFNEIKIDRNAKVRSLLLTKNPEHTLEEEEEEEEIEWPVIKFGQKCFHSSIGSFSSQSQFEQLDDNVFKTPTKETPPIILKAKESQRKVFFDISNSFPCNVNVKDKVQCAVNDDRYRINNDKSELQTTKLLRLAPVIDNNINNCNIIINNNNCIRNNSISNNCNKKENSLGENTQLASSARLRKIWRYRLGSSGDRITPSPPHISHKDIKKIKLKKLIGHGGFGAVYLGVFKDKIVAVKRLHKRVKNAKAKLESFRAECNVLNLKHPNIVQVLAASIGDSSQEAVIVMEFAGDRNLLNIINDSKQILDLTRRLKYSLELAKALEFIHSNRVVHLDLKPANVIITSKDECKLGDFGCCRLLRVQPIEAREGSNASTNDDKASPSPFTDSDFSVLKSKPQSTSQLAGTFVYRAPELLKGEPPSPLSDVFSLGITMWQMLSRKSPYAGKDKHAVIFGVVAYNVRPSFDFDIESAFDFSHSLLSIPRARCFEDYRQYDAAFLRPTSAKYDKDVSVGEKRYREIIERCWMANLNDRPWPAELIDAIQNWQY